jgi:predicted AAA+ superfamily ATPase
MKDYIHRAITERFRSSFGNGKILILYGPRQVGKTTFVRSFLGEYPNGRYFQCEQSQVREILTSWDLPRMMSMIGESDFVVFDEAQIVEDIWRALKILHDAHPEIQIIVTGSSSFDLQSRIIEPLTWRHQDFYMFPFLYSELRDHYGADFITRYSLEERILYGSYPEALSPVQWEMPRDAISRIAEDYTLKDVLTFSGIRKSETLMKLLKVLAYQIGQEVSYGSIAKDFGMSIATIETYVDILEKAFIIFRLQPYSGNKRSGIKKMRKIYFWDTWVRNALINNFESIDLRGDKWSLFENFFISEYAKRGKTRITYEELSFWRSYSGTEIDLIIEKDNTVISSYDMKWNDARKNIILNDSAPIQDVWIISKANFMQYL